MVIHDLKCTRCGRESYDILVNPAHLPRCTDCHGKLQVRWDISRRPIGVTRNTTAHPSERTVVWRNPRTGSVAYPPTNTAPMPARYLNSGYERVEFTNLASLDKFCAEKNLMNEKANFDNSGHADDI